MINSVPLFRSSQRVAYQREMGTGGSNVIISSNSSSGSSGAWCDDTRGGLLDLV